MGARWPQDGRMKTKYMRRQSKVSVARQDGYIYDATDLHLTLLELNQQGYDLCVDTDKSNRERLLVACKKTQNRFVIERIGHNEWPQY